jgi:hypothetical protein
MRSACRSISTTPSCTLVTAEHRRHFWLKSWACPRLGGGGHSKWLRPTTVQTSISWMPTAKSRRSIMPFSSASQSSTEYLIGFANDRSRTGPTLPKVKRVRSIITTAGAVSISKIPTAIFWRSSRALTVAAVGILDDHREPRWWIIFVIAVVLHDRLAVAAIRTSAIGLRMHVEQNVFHNGSSSMAASPNTDSKAIAAFVETPNFTKIESLRFLGRGSLRP